MRRSYGEAGLHESAVHTDPLAQFSRWLAEAALNPYIVEANAMVLSTIESDAAGNVRPAARTVLLKDLDGENFTFFTNYQSAKGRQIHTNPHVALLFPWYPMERQVIVKGVAAKVEQAVTDEYFASRPWGSQIGAWASSQSHELDSRETLEASYREFAEKYPEGSSVPTPPHWGGYAVVPSSIEFWQGRYSRLHDRLIFTRSAVDESSWEIGRLYP
jgi:pyridoxamine 5'-phosphate oxidase